MVQTRRIRCSSVEFWRITKIQARKSIENQGAVLVELDLYALQKEKKILLNCASPAFGVEEVVQLQER